MKNCSSVISTIVFSILVLGVSGCSSLGEGIGKVLLQQDDDQEDMRECYIRGPEFKGIGNLTASMDSPLAASDGDLKVLMVHGIGTHQPGYSTRLAENLARELGLDVVDREPKRIALRLMPGSAEAFQQAKNQRLVRGEIGDPNGYLTVTSYRSKQTQRSMVFYELTWSDITLKDKQIIEYDNSGEYSFRRAGLNQDLKKFINGHLPDPLIYLGDARGNIQSSVSQALCWMFTQDYDQIPRETDEACQISKYSTVEVHNDNYTFISHSLGSRILTDALQTVTAAMAKLDETEIDFNIQEWQGALREKSLTIFMLSNQLPLLQLGREAPEVINQYDEYCTASGGHFSDRVFLETNIVAFSDPNDLLSWAVPPYYESNHIDSRLCPKLVNVIINIAPVKSVFGLELASPGEAHRDYDDDTRVIKLIAHGMSNEYADPLVEERCIWMEVR